MEYRSRSSIVRQILSAIALGFGVMLALSLLWILGINLFYANRVLPGVTLNGISLGGKSKQEAIQAIAADYSFPQNGHILLQAGKDTWMVSPAQLGVYLDSENTAKQALAFGRTNPLQMIESSLFGYPISPTFIFDQHVALQYLTGLSGLINQPVKEASLSIENAQVTVIQGQPGRVLDLAASLQSISAQVQKMQDGIVILTVTEAQPKVLDVSQQGEQVKAILSQPFTLSLPASASQPAAGPWAIAPADLAGLLTFSETQANESTAITVEINKPLMRAYLQTLEANIDQAAQNARFVFNDDTSQLEVIQNSVQGRTLNLDQSIENINDAVLKGDHSTDLAVDVTQPEVPDTKTGADLGITQLVETYTSYFRGSHDERVQNIQTAAKSFHGLLIAPGGTLSMADVLGNISLDNGYAEAPIIIGNQTIQGVGGGVCQVSTTLFRTAFFAGYPIVERHAHAYRVGYYEQTASGHDASLAGLDATVFVPLVDFKFTNDTPYWLLMETYVNTTNYSLTWKFYSTSDGRTVDWNTTGLTNIVDPPDPQYIENPELSAGTIKQTDYAVQGADVEVDRTVTRGGQVLYSDKFVTQYEPWPDIFEYGPGTENIPTATPAP
jgi:vancomycin resistance protein YoaR